MLNMVNKDNFLAHSLICINFVLLARPILMLKNWATTHLETEEFNIFFDKYINQFVQNRLPSTLQKKLCRMQNTTPWLCLPSQVPRTDRILLVKSTAKAFFCLLACHNFSSSLDYYNPPAPHCNFNSCLLNIFADGHTTCPENSDIHQKTKEPD